MHPKDREILDLRRRIRKIDELQKVYKGAIVVLSLVLVALIYIRFAILS